MVVEKAHMPRIAGGNSGQPLHAHGKVIVGVGPVHDPPAIALSAAGSVSEASVVLRQIVVFEANEMEFGGGRKLRPRFFIVSFEADGAAKPLRQSRRREQKQR